MGVKMDRFERNFFDQFRQLFFVVRLMGETFLKFAATDERKWGLCDKRHNRVSLLASGSLRRKGLPMANLFLQVAI